MADSVKYWFNSYFRGKMVYSSPYPSPEGIENPKYSTTHGPYNSLPEAQEARRELIADAVDDRID